MIRNRFTPTRLIGIPVTADGCAPALVAEQLGAVSVANLLSVGHFPKMGVAVIYEN